MLPALALAIPAAISAGQMIAGTQKTKQANNMPLEVPAYYGLFRQDMERRRRLAENGNMMGGTLDAIRNVMGYGTQAVLKGGNVGAANFATRRSASALNEMLQNQQRLGMGYTQMGYQAGDQAAKIGYQNQAWEKAQRLNQGQELLRAGMQNGLATVFSAMPGGSMGTRPQAQGETYTDPSTIPFTAAANAPAPQATYDINPFATRPNFGGVFSQGEPLSYAPKRAYALNSYLPTQR